MISTKSWCAALVAIASMSTYVAAAPLNYPGAYPPPGGVTTNFGGAPSPGDAGGSSFIFTGFDPLAFTALYWGTYDDNSTGNSVTAGLDGTATALAFSSSSGTTATWSGLTNYTDPHTLVTTNNVPVEMVVSISGLGANPWVAAASLGLPAGVGAVADDSAGADFTANVQFLANVGGGFVALNSIDNGGGMTNSSISGGFYSVPEPSCLVLCGSLFASLLFGGKLRSSPSALKRAVCRF